MHAGCMWGSRGGALGQGHPHILARVLGHCLTHVQCMSKVSGMRLDMQHMGGGGEVDGVGMGGGDYISGQLWVVSWALGSGTRVRDAVGATTTTVHTLSCGGGECKVASL